MEFYSLQHPIYFSSTFLSLSASVKVQQQYNYNEQHIDHELR